MHLYFLDQRVIDKIERIGSQLSEIALELRAPDRRWVRLETIVEIAQNPPQLTEIWGQWFATFSSNAVILPLIVTMVSQMVPILFNPAMSTQ
jgi:hypothetical protein